MSFRKSTQKLPPLAFFDVSFRDTPGDGLYCSLNEIEPVFQQESNLDDDFRLQITEDPRTKSPVTQAYFDYSICSKPEKFKSTKRSLLTKKEHILCVKYLKSIQMKEVPSPESAACYERSFSKRQDEVKAFQQFLVSYNTTNFEKIYAPKLTCVDLYQKYCKWQVQRLMERYPDGTFQICAGFPIPRACGNSEMLGQITDIEVKSTSGGVPRCIEERIDFSTVKPKLETYLEILTNRMHDGTSGFNCEDVQFEITTEALVFLFSAGEYVDTPVEAVLTCTLRPDGECLIRIDDPLPPRNTGIHTCELVVSKCLEVFFEKKQTTPAEEISGSGFRGPYALKRIEECAQQCAFATLSETTPRTQHVKWNLCLEDKDEVLTICTQTKESLLVQNKPALFSLKVEFKPQIGYEIPSKVRLLREWFEQRLSNDSTTHTQRCRVDARTLTSMIHEELSLEDIEKQLERHYNIKIPRLLGSLMDFLKLLSKITPGRYLLRCNPRFPDKLMLYQETTAATSKTSVTLHGLLQEPVSDMAFMQMQQLVPIDDTLCTPSHLFYNVLPCAFSYENLHKQKIIDDRAFILKKAQEKANALKAKQQKFDTKRKKVKRLKRQQKLKKKAKQKQEQNAEEQELRDDIQRDRVLYGYETPSSD